MLPPNFPKMAAEIGGATHDGVWSKMARNNNGKQVS
jgi:hypothetical protein